MKTEKQKSKTAEHVMIEPECYAFLLF